MNKSTYEAYKLELGVLDMEALPTKSQLSRMEFLEKELAKYEQRYDFCQQIILDNNMEGETTHIEEIKKICKFLTNEDEEEFWDYEFSVPVHRDRRDDNYPILETMLLLRGPNGSVVAWIKIDDDEYQYVYSYLD